MGKSFRPRVAKKKYRILDRAINSYINSKKPAEKVKAWAKVLKAFSQLVDYHRQRGAKIASKLVLSESITIEVAPSSQERFLWWDPPFL